MIDQLQDELKSKDHTINKILTTTNDLTSPELKSKDNIIHKLLNQNNCKENTNSNSINQSSTKITVIFHTNIKGTTDTINTASFHLENYCKEHNAGFIDNGNIKKSDLNSKRLHLHERGSSELTKSMLNFIY